MQRVRHLWTSQFGIVVVFGLATLAMAALIWMGVEGVGFPTWLLALTTVL